MKGTPVCILVKGSVPFGLHNGNVMSQIINSGGTSFTQNYTYDELNRIEQVSESGPQSWTRDYTYDIYGNRAATGLQVAVSTPASTAVYNAQNNRLGATWANYDNAGNLTAFKNPSGTSPGR